MLPRQSLRPRPIAPSNALGTALGTALGLALAATVGCSTAALEAEEDSGDVGSEIVARLASGTIAGTDIFVATVVEDDLTIAYFCGGDDTFATHTRWFSGPPGASDAIEHAANGWRVDALADADGASGTLTDPDGIELAFQTTAVTGSSLAGLYSAEIDGCRAGVVVVDLDGEPRAQGTLRCEDGPSFVQVIIVAPVALTNGGIDVVFDLDGTATMLNVQPV